MVDLIHQQGKEQPDSLTTKARVILMSKTATTETVAPVEAPEVEAPKTPVAPAPAVTPFDSETINSFVGKKGYSNKFFAELMPKFNELLELHSAYKAISGGVEAAQLAAIEGLTEESNPEMFEVYNSLAEAEELVVTLRATLDEWAAAQVAESTESPDAIKEAFALIKTDVDSKINGAADYFERNEDVIEDEDGTIIPDSEDGANYLKLKNDLPTMRRGKGSKPVNTRGKQVREWVKANDIKSPEGKELGRIGVIPQWAFDAFDAANQ